ncbi:MAG: hypothetical protein HDT30_09400 [Clostridiales bacterium]|nr:hypothetical protein [Clostridiales bacterium]
MNINRYIRNVIVIALIIVTCGCSTKHQITHPIVKEKMNLLGIQNCQITKLGEIPECKYTDEEIEVSISEIEENIQLILESYEKLKPVDRNVVKKGDFVNLTYTVYCEGKIVNESKGEEIKVGAGFFNEEIERKLIGAKKNKMYSINIQVPKEDENKEYAGKKEEIKYQVNEIYYMFQPQLTDKFVQENYGLKNIEEFYEYEKNCILEEKKAEQINEKREDIMEELIEKSIFNMDRNYLLDYAEVVYHEYEDMATGYGSSIEEFIKDFFNENLDEFYERCCNEAEKEIKKFLIIGAIANKINVDISDKDIEEKYENLNADNLDDMDIVLYKYEILEEKVLNYLLKKRK